MKNQQPPTLAVEVIGPVHGVRCRRCIDAGFIIVEGQPVFCPSCPLGQAEQREWEASLAGVCCICGHAGPKEGCLSCEARLGESLTHEELANVS